MRPRGSCALAALLALFAAVPCLAAGSPGSGARVLDRFFDGLHSFSADFTQTATDAEGHPTLQASGRLLVLRPGRFRWEVHPQGEGMGQLLIADGRNLWYYDRDLEQVTVKPEQAALSATPAMILSGGPDALAAFDVSAAAAPVASRAEGGSGSADNGRAAADLDWVRVAPKASDADFREALLGFSGNGLRRMILKDKLGGTSVIVFQRAERNAPISNAEVSFTPPAGADVIGTPAK